MSAATDFAQLQKLTPQEAVDWLIARGHLTKSYAWQDVWQDEHGHQFTVSRLARLDLLQALYEAIVQSVQGDLSRKDWMRDAEQLLTDAGWWGTKAVTDPADGEIKLTKFDAARLRLIYDTNTRQAYATGLWERVERSKRTHPYVRYITKQDERVRASHRAWDNLVLPVDDAFWKTHWPPNGWRCRCRRFSRSRGSCSSALAAHRCFRISFTSRRSASAQTIRRRSSGFRWRLPMLAQRSCRRWSDGLVKASGLPGFPIICWPASRCCT